MDKRILLSLDVEEFDICSEYGSILPFEEQILVSKQGLAAIMELFYKHTMPVTLYTTGSFAEAEPELLRSLAAKHEIASHGLHHGIMEETDIISSKKLLESISGQKVYGIRSPRMQRLKTAALEDAGYSYDSSLNPVYLPGRYNNLQYPRTPFLDGKVLELPASAWSSLRVPLFWLSFKNLPFSVFAKMARTSLNATGYLNLYFHPWEFADLKRYKLPSYIAKPSGKDLLAKLEKLILSLKDEGTFIKSSDYCHEWLKQNTK